MTPEEQKIYEQGAIDFAKILEIELQKKTYEMPNKPNLKYVYAEAIPIAIHNALATLNAKNLFADNKTTPSDYTECEYFVQEDATPWHNDIFDHPEYKYFCTKNNTRKELAYPAGQCKRCLENAKQ